MALPNYTTEQCVMYYDAVLEFSTATYEENLRSLSDVDLNDPATINLYASSFENKDILEKVIADYNDILTNPARVDGPFHFHP